MLSFIHLNNFKVCFIYSILVFSTILYAGDLEDNTDFPQRVLTSRIQSGINLDRKNNIFYKPVFAPLEYTLKIKYSNNDGIWKNESISNSKIIILPFWKKWWIYIVAGATLLIAIMALIILKMKNENLIKYKDQLRSLTRELSRNQEQERKKMASYLHNNIGHSITNIINKIDTLRVQEKTEIIKKHLDEIYDLSDKMLDEVSSISSDLCPPVLYELGLVTAIKWLLEKIKKDYGLKVEYRGPDSLVISNENIEIFIYHSIKELLMNVNKYAETDKAFLQIRRDADFLKIIISDRGNGFDKKNLSLLHPGTQKSGLGLFCIKEHINQFNGKLEIDSISGKGTEVTLFIPLVEFGR